jgi:hypothetical protein
VLPVVHRNMPDVPLSRCKRHVAGRAVSDKHVGCGFEQETAPQSDDDQSGEVDVTLTIYGRCCRRSRICRRCAGPVSRQRAPVEIEPDEPAACHYHPVILPARSEIRLGRLRHMRVLRGIILMDGTIRDDIVEMHREDEMYS